MPCRDSLRWLTALRWRAGLHPRRDCWRPASTAGQVVTMVTSADGRPAELRTYARNVCRSMSPPAPGTGDQAGRSAATEAAS